jgi:F-type H+-transporting ATPase subunit b
MKRRHLIAALLVILGTASAAHASSLPQMDPTWYKNQLLWLAISFGILYVVVARFITPNIAGVLASREAAINDAIAEAELAKREAEETRGDSESARHDARIRAAEAMAKAQAEANADAARELAKLDHELNRRADHASAILEEAVAKARGNVDAAARDLAQAMADKLVADAKAAPSSKATLKLATAS